MKLGIALAREQDRRLARDPKHHTAARARFLAGLPRARSTRTNWLVSATLGIAALMMVWLASRHSPQGIRLGNGGEAKSPSGAQLLADGDERRAVAFHDGSKLVIERGADTRVVQSSAAEVQVAFEGGGMKAWVEAAVARWGVAIRLYRPGLGLASLLGRQWHASTQGLNPSISDGPRRLTQDTEVVSPAGLDRSPERRHHAAVSLVGPRVPGSVARLRSEPASQPEALPRVPKWRELADAYRYGEAYSAAKAEGLQSLQEKLSADDLLRLSDVARFAGHPLQAKATLLAARRRFGGTRAASIAAFELGRISALRGNHIESTTWFSSYLEEQPSGTLAREALGRLMLSLKTSGQNARAAQAARQYLRRFPDGPHAEQARDLVGHSP